jgi:hypothetical protein
VLRMIQTENWDGIKINGNDWGTIIGLLPSTLINKFGDDGKLLADFKLEIQSQWLNNSQTYFDLISHIFDSHFQFIKAQFAHLLNYYLKNKGEVVELIAKPRQGQSISNGEIFKIIGFDYIHKFNLLESILKDNYPKYEPTLKREAITLPEYRRDYIHLNYDKDVLPQIYRALNNKYIRCTFKEFEAIFDKKVIFKTKVHWLSGEPNLVYLFTGHDLTNGEKIKTTNVDILSLLPKYFCNKKGKDFKASQLRVVDQKHVEKPRDFGGIQNLIFELNS